MPLARLRLLGTATLVLFTGSCATFEDQTLFDSTTLSGVSAYFYQTNVLGVCCGMMGQAYNANPNPVCVEMSFGGGRRVATVPAGATVEVYRTDITGWSGTPRVAVWDPRSRACAA